MAAEYEVAQVIHTIAQRLINDHHQKLKGQRVEYLFKIEKPKKKEKAKREALGDVKVISGLNAYLAGDPQDPFGEPFFVLLIKRHLWDRIGDERTREAVIDWLLCRCGFDEKSGAPKKRDFDVAGFSDNVRRYGAWYEDLREFFDARAQFDLPLDQPPAPTPAPGGRKGVRRVPRKGVASANR